MTRAERIAFARAGLAACPPGARGYWQRQLARAEAAPLDWHSPPATPALAATATRLAEELFAAHKRR
jgi:hypothetical protein